LQRESLVLMDGKIDTVFIQPGATPGETIARGQTLAVLEAMKMKFAISSGVDDQVATVSCQTGQQVKGRQLLIAIKSAAALTD
jgi:geranyl-CoA carboxylase alpha subunit